MKKCLKCGVSPITFRTKMVLDMDVLVDEYGDFVRRLKSNSFEKKYGSLYICTACEAEYVKIEPLMLHAK